MNVRDKEPINLQRERPRKTVQRAAPEAARLTLDQAALEIPCSRKFLEIKISRKELSAVRLGRKVFVTREALSKFLAANLKPY